jgi:hypothetical protein
VLKLDILTAVCTKDNIQSILGEFQIYIKHPTNMEYVSAVIRALGRVADVDTEVAGKCTDGLLQLIHLNKKNPLIVQQSVIVIRQLIQQNSGTAASQRALNVLAKLLVLAELEGADGDGSSNPITEPSARANIIWLIGEYHDVLIAAAPDLLRLLAVSFVEESTESKAQILKLAVKHELNLPPDENFQTLMTYILEMSRYDVDTDLRDRSRFMTALMGLAPSAENEEEGGASATNAVDEAALEQLAERAKSILLAPKLPPVTLNGAVDIEALPDFTVGSLSSLVGHYVAGYLPMQSWPDRQPDPSVRDTLLRESADINDHQSAAANRGGAGESKKGKGKTDTLTGFYDKEDKDSSSEGSGSSEEESDSDEESGSESGSETGSEAESESESESEDDETESSSSEEEAVRVPIAQQKTRQVAMRKVIPGKKGSTTAAGTNVDNLLGGLGSIDLMGGTAPAAAGSNSVTSAFGATTVAPGAGFASSFDDLSDIFPPSQPIAQPTFDVFGELGMEPVPPPVAMQAHMPGAQMGHANLMMQNQMGSPMQQPQMGSPMQQQMLWQQQQMQQMLQMQQMQQSMMNMNNMNSMNPMAPTGMGMGMGMMNAPTGMQPPVNPMMMGLNTASIGSPPVNNMAAASSGKQSSPAPSVPGPATDAVIDEVLSEPKELLSPDLAGGLSVSMVYRYSSEPVAYSGAHCVYFDVKNTSADRNIRRIKIGIPPELRHTNFEDIAVLAPGQQVKIPVEIVLQGSAG